ncbi:hypothetical protein ACI1TM_08580 [Lactococcus garvieae]|uniref:hypothetical protein n=1 Tax=Lactococcus garvieae TaxID=1363 RepID=UPI003853EC59
MTLNTDDFHFILAQFLLVDPTSEDPKIHPELKNIKQLQLQSRLKSWIEQVQEADLDVPLDDYKLALKTLRNIKKKEDYEVLLLEIVESYEDLSDERKTREKEREHCKKEKSVHLNKVSATQDAVLDQVEAGPSLHSPKLWQRLMQKVTKNKGQK